MARARLPDLCLRRVRAHGRERCVRQPCRRHRPGRQRRQRGRGVLRRRCHRQPRRSHLDGVHFLRQLGPASAVAPSPTSVPPPSQGPRSLATRPTTAEPSGTAAPSPSQRPRSRPTRPTAVEGREPPREPHTSARSLAHNGGPTEMILLRAAAASCGLSVGVSSRAGPRTRGSEQGSSMPVPRHSNRDQPFATS